MIAIVVSSAEQEAISLIRKLSEWLKRKRRNASLAIKTRLNAQSSVMSSKSANLRADRKCAMPEKETGSFKRYLTFWRIFSIL